MLVKNSGVVLGILMPESTSRETCPIDVLLANHGEAEFMCPEIGGLLDCVVKVRMKGGNEVPYTKMGAYRFENEVGFDHRALIIYDPDEIRHWQFDLFEAFAPFEAGEYHLSLKTTVFFRDTQTKEFSKAVDIVAKDIPFTITSSQEARTLRHFQRDREGIMKEAEDLVLTRNRMGANLTSILRDSEQPVAERHDAARLLGKLQYMPAIAVLVQHVDLVDPTSLESEPRPDLTYPQTTALAAYGNAAVPQIVDAFLAERNHQRQGLLFLAIRFGKTTDVALRYLRGTERPDEKDWLKKQNIEELEKKLTSSFAR